MRYGLKLEDLLAAADTWLCPHCYEEDHPQEVQFPLAPLLSRQQTCNVAQKAGSPEMSMLLTLQDRSSSLTEQHFWTIMPFSKF